MNEKEMRDFYQTIKYSEQSANQEKQYRETLMNANKHCEEVMLLRSETSLTSEKKEKVIEVTTIDDNSSDSNYSTGKKETEEVETNNTVKSPSGEKGEEPEEKKNQLFFSYEKVRNDLCLDTVTALPPFYCRSVIQKLPQQFAMLALKKHHELIASVYNRSVGKNVRLCPLPKEINLPRFSLNQEKEKSIEEPQNESIQKDVQTPTKNEGYSCVRSRRHIKRKHYTEFNTDDEDDDELTAIKKCKEESLKTHFEYDSMDEIFDSLKEPTRKDGQSSDEEPSMPMKVSVEVHTVTDGKKIATSTPLADKKWKRNVNIVSDNGMDDIIECFDEDSMAGSAQKRKNDQLDPAEDSNDCGVETKDFVRRRIVPPNPYVDKLSQKMENKIKNLNNRRSKRPNSLCKPDSQKSKSQSNKENEEDALTGEIETKRFYGKTKANANKSRYASLPFKEDEYECPMCNKYFPLTFIEVINVSSALKIVYRIFALFFFLFYNTIFGIVPKQK